MRVAFLAVIMMAAGLSVLVTPPASAAPCDPPVVNPIACENTKPGSPENEWGITGAGSTSIQGYASDISVDQGGTVGFKVDTSASSYRLDIYRMGYYAGSGARKVATVQPTLLNNQPECLTDATTGLIDCGNWRQNAAWPVPADAVSGVYFAKLVRTDGTAGASHIYFVVRDDDGGSGMLFQTSDTTWQAYNTYGGNSLYTGAPAGRAYKVSYNRPFTTRDNAPEDFVFNAEYPMVRFLESNGYDVSYSTGVDTDRRGAELLEHKAFLSVGHDEYWSGRQRTNVEAARAAGVHLAFFSGNEIFWKTRWENSIDGSGTPSRTLVSYKETHNNAVIDPETPTWTGTWRDPRFSPPADGGRPENALSGQMFMVNCCAIDMEVGSAEGKMRFWRNTRVANLAAGASTTVGSNVIGYEWDEDRDNGFRPAGSFRLSETSGTGQVLQDYGSTYAQDPATHSMTMYKAPSGALVFGAGTIQWSWALDGNHDQGSAAPDTAAQQATVNLFADMGVQPATLQSGLTAATASTDTVAPSSVITSPAADANVAVGSRLTVSGTATDSGGGRVGGVEVSIDDGATWHRASGRETWTYSFTASTSGAMKIRSRSTDDSGNSETAGLGITVTAGDAPVSCPCSIWPDSAVPEKTDPDRKAVEVGVRFRAAVDGVVTGIRFYKPSVSTGTHVGTLWSGTGTKLGSVTFTNETASGWQRAMFATPIPVTRNTTYVASYFAPSRYASSQGYFTTATTRGPLTALQDGVDGANGVYRYGSTPGSFPEQTWKSENYWVDVVFEDVDKTKPGLTSRTPAPGATGVPLGSTVNAVFDEAVQQSTIAFELRDPADSLVPAATSYDAATRKVTLDPAADLRASVVYTASLSGAKDAAGNTMDPVTWTFTTTTSPYDCPCTIWPSTAPSAQTDPDTSPVELGVKFRVAQDGYITGIRYYRPAEATGTHVGTLWTRTGTKLASVTFTGGTTSGWQQATFSAPVAVSADTTYVASYFAPSRYAATSSYFSSETTRGPLTALRDGADGGNGVYRYSATAGVFPTSTYDSANYWVDVVYQESAADTSPPTVTSRVPAPGATSIPVTSKATATFSEAVTAGSVSMEMRTDGGQVVPATTSYDAATWTVTLAPDRDLAYSAGYTVSVTGATDSSGNTMAPVSWSFQTTAPPPAPIDQGPGGPIAVVTSATNKSTSYLAEILRAEGLNEFSSIKDTELSATTLAAYDVVVLGEGAINDAQVTALTDWANAGGNLIAMKPDGRLLGLAGLTAHTGTVSDGYIAVDASTEPGAGITTETMQFHGAANRYSLNGATAVAALYTSATASAGNPAVTWRSVGSNGGQVAVFAYDLARSVIQTRQGNPAWAGQDRDGATPNRANDLFYGGSVADWVNLSKAQIPQADEQQRLLANLVTVMNRDRMPIPRFWYFPAEHKAVVVATGDDHGNGGTSGRFDTYRAASPAGCSLVLWKCARFSSYVYPSTPLSNSAAASYNDEGFEVGLHPQNGCANYSSLTSLQDDYASELASWLSAYPSLPAPTTSRFHCIVWSDWASQPKAELAHGIRLDTNYYYYPGSWIADRPGFMNGSGMPMRFTDTDGSLIDVYQSNTVMTDESGQSYPFTPDTLLDRALGAQGYYGAFTANVHTDSSATFEDTQLLASAQERGVPVVSGRQLLTWLDGRNASSFADLSWDTDTLAFKVQVGAGANQLTAMLPTTGPDGQTLSSLTRGGSPVSLTLSTVKGQQYALFSAVGGAYQATYVAGGGTMSLTAARTTSVTEDSATVAWQTDEPASTTLAIGTSPNALTTRMTVAERSETHEVVAEDLEPGQTYYYRVLSEDVDGEVRSWPARSAPPASFRTPAQDTVRPVVRDVKVFPLPGDTARVTWRTNEPGRSHVQFGTSETQLSETRFDTARVTEHTVVLTGLRPRETYWLRVSSVDGSGNASAAGGLVRLPMLDPGVAQQTKEEFRTGTSTGDVVIGTDGFGVITLSGPGAGRYESAVIDTGAKVDWKRAVIDRLVPPGARATLSMRSGWTPRPDRSWSSWTPSLDEGDSVGRSGRFLQYRIDLSASSQDVPSVSAVGFTHSGEPPEEQPERP